MSPRIHTSPDALGHELRPQFPILSRRVNGKPLVYLDNAATTHKPESVLRAVDEHYRQHNANVHRGVHRLSQEATDAQEAARAKVQRFLGARHVEEIIFVRGTTEGINLVAQAWGPANVRAGDEILVTEMEHHSNIVPWQMLCQRVGARLVVAPINDAGELLLDEFEARLTPATRLVAVTHTSNALGTVNPLSRLIAMAHKAGARVLVDAAQAVPHAPIDVASLNADFLALSGHKMYGPMGIGVLWGRKELLSTMPPWQGGGEMIRSVRFEGTTYAPPPHRFEAGTPDVGGIVGLGAAVDFLQGIGMERIASHEADLLAYGTEQLAAQEGVRIIGTAGNKAGVLSFVMTQAHPHDIGTILDEAGIAVRTGHHCAQPVMEHFGLAATARASIGAYNTRRDIDTLIAGLARVREVFGS